MKKHLLLTFIFIALFSCKEIKKAEPQTESNQMKEVMAIHDEVMPKMGAIGKLVSELKNKVDTTAQGLKYEKAMKELQEANKAMMDWMHSFGDQFDSDEVLNGKALSEAKKKLLGLEEEKIKTVREQINLSIENAEKLLKSGEQKIQ